MRSLKQLLPLLLAAPLTLAARLTIALPPASLSSYEPSALPASTHATLLGPPDGRGSTYHSVPLSRANTFVFEGLGQGSYLLQVHARDFVFAPLRVDVAEGEGEGGKETVDVFQTFRGHEWSNKGVRLGGSSSAAEGGDADAVVVDVRPAAGREFYQQRGGFELLSFFKNPMILMALFSLVLIVGMPYMMENMDPETRAEFDEMQKKSPLASPDNPAARLQNFDLAGWMAGKTSGQSE
ncbi:hypothetical protein LTR04_005015, partial [Oleoguttula sp. CCFEE 6159]